MPLHLNPIIVTLLVPWQNETANLGTSLRTSERFHLKQSETQIVRMFSIQ